MFMAHSTLLETPVRLITEFLRLESAGGLMLMAAAALALVLANSPAAPAYHAALATHIGIGKASLSLLLWINDPLMAIFFLLVGLEIKRELLTGELSSMKRAALPAIASLGGMLVPALIYLGLNAEDAATLRGWAIPAATDIAFALGILALLGSRVPVAPKVFFTALAILDDLGAIVIIALFYSADLSGPALASAAAAVALLFALNRLGVRRLLPYLLIGVFLWGAVLTSSIHATLAGVVLALTIPLRVEENRTAQHDDTEDGPLHRLERALHPWVAYGIVPIFGLANAGLSFEGLAPAAVLGAVPLGIALRLFIGKQVGVLAACWLAVKLRWAELPEGASAWQVYGVAVLCGIGFTMSLFIGGLAFTADAMRNQVKLGVFSGSVIAAAMGYVILRLAPARTAPA
jgi:Na+:H+ antiporter, NhaA family